MRSGTGSPWLSNICLSFSLRLFSILVVLAVSERLHAQSLDNASNSHQLTSGIGKATFRLDSRGQELVSENCLHCHDQGDPAGNVDLNLILSRETSGKPGDLYEPGHSLSTSPFDTREQVAFRLLRKMEEVLDQGAMPPPSETPLGDSELEVLLESVSHTQNQLVDSAEFPSVEIRRMNRFQYNNAVQDLLDLRVDVFALPERMLRAYGYYKPDTGKMPERLKAGSRPLGKSQLIAPRLEGVAPFPQDLRAEHGFDNRADHLSLSPLLMESLLKLSRSIVYSRDFGPKTVGSWNRYFKSPEFEPAEPALETLRRLFEERIEDLLTLAFRRPVTKEEVKRYTEYALSKQAESGDFAESMKSVVSAVLASPKFLYLYSEDSKPEFALASRLSFFLWGSIPDKELLLLAEQGRLSHADELAAQTRRMLNDAKSKRFCDSFPAQWLQLERIVTSIPDAGLFPDFYFVRFRSSMHMMLEPLLLFETVLVENLPITTLIHSDFSYRSDLLKAWYANDGRNSPKPPTAIPFQRVAVNDAREGGVITCAATMTMTSGPRETKPITRGAWLLSVILNSPPEPPPADVPPLPDTNAIDENQSVRERFALHRESDACSGCHRKLDPLGFALENFDPVGHWRKEDEKGNPIDASGILWGKHEFRDATELKTILLQHPARFTEAFSRHLLSFALGRELRPADFRSIHLIGQTWKHDSANGAASKQAGLRDLLVAITTSEAFRSFPASQTVAAQD
ncbi:MAG: DUF1592 domain-containing protein [Aureliella sp.]